KLPAKLASVIGTAALPVPPALVSLATSVWLPVAKLGSATLHAPDASAVVVPRLLPPSLIVTTAFGLPDPVNDRPDRFAVTTGAGGGVSVGVVVGVVVVVV